MWAQLEHAYKTAVAHVDLAHDHDTAGDIAVQVHIDQEQLAWLEQTLQTFEPSKPVVIATHAPPLGCGLKVLNDLHIKNRCAGALQSHTASSQTVAKAPSLCQTSRARLCDLRHKLDCLHAPRMSC